MSWNIPPSDPNDTTSFVNNIVAELEDSFDMEGVWSISSNQLANLLRDIDSYVATESKEQTFGAYVDSRNTALTYALPSNSFSVYSELLEELSGVDLEDALTFVDFIGVNPKYFQFQRMLIGYFNQRFQQFDVPINANPINIIKDNITYEGYISDRQSRGEVLNIDITNSAFREVLEDFARRTEMKMAPKQELSNFVSTLNRYANNIIHEQISLGLPLLNIKQKIILIFKLRNILTRRFGLNNSI